MAKKKHWTQDASARRKKPTKHKTEGNKLIGLRVPEELLKGMRAYAKKHKLATVQRAFIEVACGKLGIELDGEE